MFCGNKYVILLDNNKVMLIQNETAMLIGNNSVMLIDTNTSMFISNKNIFNHLKVICTHTVYQVWQMLSPLNRIRRCVDLEFSVRMDRWHKIFLVVLIDQTSMQLPMGDEKPS